MNKPDLLDRIKAAVIFWWQRRTRGWDDSEIWDLDRTIMKFALPRLKRLRETTIGYPMDFYHGDMEGLSERVIKQRDERALDAWHRTIRKMERAFELWLEHGGIFGHADEKADKFITEPELEAEFKEGWELFCKYFFALWD